MLSTTPCPRCHASWPLWAAYCGDCGRGLIAQPSGRLPLQGWLAVAIVGGLAVVAAPAVAGWLGSRPSSAPQTQSGVVATSASPSPTQTTTASPSPIAVVVTIQPTPSPTPQPTPPPTAAPVIVQTAPPPPPPTVAPAPKIVAVPALGTLGTTFVFQLSNFPQSATGQDISQTITTPAGKQVGPTNFRTQPNGTGLTFYTPTAADPAGLYIVRITAAGGGFTTQTTFQVN